MDKVIERLKAEGYTSEEIIEALRRLTEEAKDQQTITGSLDEYLDSIDERPSRKDMVTPLKVTQFVGLTKIEKENNKMLRKIKGDL